MSDVVTIELVTDASTVSVAEVFSKVHPPVGSGERVDARLGEDSHHVSVHVNRFPVRSQLLSRPPDIVIWINFELSRSALAVQGQQLAEAIVPLVQRVDITEGAVWDLDFAHYLYWSQGRVVCNAHPAVADWDIGKTIFEHFKRVGLQYETKDLGVDIKLKAFFTARSAEGSWQTLWRADHEIGAEYVQALTDATTRLGRSSGITRRGYEDFLVDPAVLEQSMLELVESTPPATDKRARDRHIKMLARSIVLLETSGRSTDSATTSLDGLASAVRELQHQMRL